MGWAWPPPTCQYTLHRLPQAQSTGVLTAISCTITTLQLIHPVTTLVRRLFRRSEPHRRKHIHIFAVAATPPRKSSTRAGQFLQADTSSPETSDHDCQKTFPLLPLIYIRCPRRTTALFPQSLLVHPSLIILLTMRLGLTTTVLPRTATTNTMTGTRNMVVVLRTIDQDVCLR